jgi:hypothetical protein
MRTLFPAAALLLFLLPLVPLSAQETNRTTQVLEREESLETVRLFLEAGEGAARMEEIEALIEAVREEGTPRQVERADYLLFLARGQAGKAFEASLKEEADEYRLAQQTAAGENTLFWISSGAGLAGMGLYGLFSSFYASAYGDYLEAGSGDEADRLKEEWRRWDLARYISLGLGTASLTAAALLFPLPEEEGPQNIARLRHRYAGLEGAGALRMERILQDQAELMRELEASRIEAAPFLKWRNISLVGAGTFTAAAATFLVLTEVAYRRYSDSVYSSDAEEYRGMVRTYGYLSAGSGAAAVLSLGSAGVLETLRPRPEDMEAELRAYEALLKQ